MKILFVDDEKDFLDILSKRLEKRGLTPSAVYGGAEALNFLADHKKMDVVVLDVKMPGMDGLEILTEIKAKFPLVEVIMLTGHATVDSAIEGMKQGAFDYMMKPCDIDQLIEKLEGAVAKKKGHEEKIMEARMQEIVGHRV